MEAKQKRGRRSDPKPKTAGFAGLRLKEAEQEALIEIEMYLSREKIRKVTTSGLMRAFLMNAEIDEVLIDQVKATVADCKDMKHAYTLSLGIDGKKRLLAIQKRMDGILQHASEHEIDGTVVSGNDVMRALIVRYRKPERSILGAIRFGVTIDKEKTAQKREKKKAK